MVGITLKRWAGHGGLMASVTILFEVLTVMLLRVRETLKIVNR